jgi:hypothetical protein
MKQIVLSLIAEGKTTPEIAWATGMSLQYINKIKREETEAIAVKGRPRIENPEEKRTLYLYKTGRLTLDVASATLNMSEQTFKRRLKDYDLDQNDKPLRTKTEIDPEKEKLLKELLNYDPSSDT